MRVGLLLLLACSPLAAAAAHGEERPDPPAAPRHLDLRVVSLNTWLIPVFSKAYEQRRERMPKALEGLRADVLCLQEIWSPKDQETFVRALKKTLPHSHPTRSGLLVLSRHRLVDPVFTPFPADEELPPRERIIRKGHLSTELVTPVGRVGISTAHLAAMPQPGGPRSRQLTLLIDALDDARHLPLILAADLNFPAVRGTALAGDYQRLLDAGFRDANPPRASEGDRWLPGEVTWRRWPRGTSRGYRRDYVLFRPGKTHGVVLRKFQQRLDGPDTALSDHNAQVLDVRITVKRTKARPSPARGPAKEAK